MGSGFMQKFRTEMDKLGAHPDKAIISLLTVSAQKHPNRASEIVDLCARAVLSVSSTLGKGESGRCQRRGRRFCGRRRDRPSFSLLSSPALFLSDATLFLWTCLFRRTLDLGLSHSPASLPPTACPSATSWTPSSRTSATRSSPCSRPTWRPWPAARTSM